MPKPAAAVPAVTRTVLPNGLVVLIQEDHSFPVVAVNAWIRAGSRHEDDRIAGSAHYLEHLTARGTQKRQPLQARMEIISRGGDNGADTYYDRTQYYNVVARDDFPLALDGLADILQNARNTPQEVEHERRVVSEELRLGLDNPNTLVYNGMMRLLFPDHPYGRPVIGTPQSIGGLTAGALQKFYRSLYAPNNMVVVIAGDIEADRALALTREGFGGFAPNHRLPRPSGPAPAFRGFQEGTERADVRQPILTIGFIVPGFRHPDRPALELLARVLGQGNASRLNQAGVSRSQLASYLSCWYLPLAEQGVLAVTGQPLEVSKFYALKRLAWGELVKLRGAGITEEELRSAKQMLRLEYLFARENILEQAKDLGEAELFGGIRYSLDYLGRIERVTREDVERVAATYLVRDNAASFDLLPRKGPRLTAHERAEIAELVEALGPGSGIRGGFEEVLYRGEGAYRIPDQAENREVVPRRPHLTRRWRLKNGVVVIVRREPRLPLVSLAVSTFAGSRFSRQPGLAELTAQSLFYGGWRFSDREVREQMDRWGNRYHLGAGRDTADLHLTVEKSAVERALELTADLFIHPTFYDAEVEAGKRGQIAWIRRDDEDGRSVAYRTWRRRLYGDHPYGQPVYGTEDSVQQLTRENLLDFHGANYRPDRTVVTLVGDIEPEEGQRLVEHHFGGWEGAPDRPPAAGRGRPRPQPGRHNVTLAKQQAYLLVGVPAVSLNHEDYWPLYVLSSLLGIRNFTDLIYNKSIAYQSTSSLDALAEAGALNVYLSTQAGEARRGEEELVAKLRQVVEERVSDEELASIRQRITGGRALSEQSTATLASSLAAWELVGPGYRFYEEFPEHIGRVTARDLQRVTRQYIDLGNLVTVIVGPD